ncbi:MAG: hypothetical protein IBX50_11410 [Marinospirillum sp.]|uniref:DUF2231 domain-containing protein n=1 Tax=Marinospirillum sp. TaxID=2183934 RepID=UPI0019FA5673|nr:DUF2231 domain-containing protein [Marinospirillum sp.]MBE0507304.1 hypothetical protein [Marinospirillum sp.]
MAAYHHIMAHFPIALLLLASLLLLLRALSNNPALAKLEKSTPILLIFGLLGGIAAILTGLMLWPHEAVLASPMAKNKILFATWTMIAWIGVAAVRLRAGEGIWETNLRWPLVILALLAAGMLSTTGALGGYLMGSPSDFSTLLKLLGWNVYQTFHAPGWALGVAVIAALLILLTGFMKKAR